MKVEVRFDIVTVVTSSQRKAFIDFPHDLYQSDPYYVPELFQFQKEMFDEKKYPFYQYGEVISYLAYREEKLVGRICAIHNPRYNDYHQSNVGFFGFFDLIDDFEVAKALLTKAKEWLAAKGLSAVIGPTNFTTHDASGLLVEGFDSPPKMMTTYNKRYYEPLLLEYGFVKEMDLLAYMIYTSEVSDRSIRLAEMMKKRLLRSGITVRPFNRKDFKNEVEKLKFLYNAAWEKNWGFVPCTDAEFEHTGGQLKFLEDPRWCYMAEHNGQPIGFSLTMPDINEVLIDIPKGRLFPTGIFKLLLRKNRYRSVRILTLGVLEEYRKKGIESLFFANNIIQGKKQNLIGGEASWVLENNHVMRNAIEKLNGKKYKTYRLYRHSINA